VDKTIRNIDERLYREAKARAALDGKGMGDIVSEALALYLAPPVAARKDRSLRELVTERYPKGSEHLSEEVDAIVYGG
jgi:plasmid stability protein